MSKGLQRLLRIALLASLAFASGAGRAAEEDGRPVYRVAIDREYAPYEFVDAEGEIRGFTPELLSKIGEAVGVTFRFTPMAWPDAVAGLEQGRIDLVNMIRTPQRLGHYEFSEGHSHISQGIFRHSWAHSIHDLRSLAGHRVALQRNDISLEMLGNSPGFSRVLVRNKAEGFLLLNAGKVDAFLAADQAGLRLIQELGLRDVEPVMVGLFQQEFCFAARKGNRDLIELLNSGLKQVQESGEYDQIVGRWLALRVPKRNLLEDHWRVALGFVVSLALILVGFVVWNVMLRRAVARQTKALRESRNSLQEAQRIARLGSWEWDVESDGVRWSDEILRIFGVGRDELAADFAAFTGVVHPDDRQRIRGAVRAALRDRVPEWTLDYRIQRPDGEVRFVHEKASSVVAADGRILKRVGTIQDISDRRQLEESMQRMNRELRALSDCNQILLKAEDEQTLLNDVCRIICDGAGYRLAWVGYAEQDAQKTVRPVAWAGAESGYLGTAHITWDDSPQGQGPTGRAIRDGQTACIQDFGSDPLSEPWRAGALQRGYRSSIALPLKDGGGGTFGALNIYSAEPQAFTPKETSLLEGLAGDLAFGIAVMKNRIALERAEQMAQARLRMIEAAQAADITQQDALRCVLDEIEAQTESRIAFYHFLEEDQQTLFLQAWSTNTLTAMCTADADQRHYPVTEAGVWADSVRERRPVIHNDYASLPHRRGTPAGHAAVIRELTVPVFRGDQIVAIVGVGNKPEDYTETDVQVVSLLADSSWEIVVRRQAQEALRASELRYRLGQSAAHIGTWEYDVATNRFWGSDEAKRIYGFATDVTDFSTETIESRIPERERVHQALVDLIEKNQPYNLEFEIHPADGSAPKTISSVAELYRDGQDRPAKVIGVIQDITERKKTARALQRGQTLLSEAEAVGRSGTFDWDLRSNRATWSPGMHRLFEIPSDRFDGDPKTVFEVVHPEDVDQLAHAMQRVLEAGELVNHLEYRIVPPSGVVRHIWAQGTLDSDEHGNATRMIGTCTDITDRVEAEQEISQLNRELERRVRERTAELEAANRELESFAYSVSHDLRAPLRHVDGFVGLLRQRLSDAEDEQTRHYMAVLSKSAERMGRLIDDLLYFSRMGRAEMSKGRVDLAVLVAELVRELEPEAARRKVKWRVGNLPTVSGDRTLLRTVLGNLLANALKFTRPRETAEIEVGCRSGQPSETVIFVRDNGVGFDPAYAGKLFGVFQRLHRAEQFEGTGIGLANVRRIIARHGGRTWAEGAVDQGATFYFSLPQAGRDVRA